MVSCLGISDKSYTPRTSRPHSALSLPFLAPSHYHYMRPSITPLVDGRFLLVRPLNFLGLRAQKFKGIMDAWSSSSETLSESSLR
jgi:hypothetical protein